MGKYIYELKMKVRDYECDLQGIVNYLFTAEKMATPKLKLDDQKSVFPPSVQSFFTSSPCSSSQPVLPDTSFTPAAKVFM